MTTSYRSCPRELPLALFIVFSLLLVHPGESLGQAYCALRDPVRSIQSLFPGKPANYRSVVRQIDREHVLNIAQQLQFPLHHNEMGKHTLYLVSQGGNPKGYVHARSEKGKWGLVEVVWAFDLDLNVVGFEIQRCRDRERTSLETDSFLRAIQGKGFPELRKLVNQDGTSLSAPIPGLAPEAEFLAATVIRSGLKALAATDEVWLTAHENTPPSR